MSIGEDSEEDIPANLLGDEDPDAPQYAGRIHQFPVLHPFRLHAQR
jgi:hypothetical protein